MQASAFIAYFECVAPLGANTEEIFEQLLAKKSGIQQYEDTLASYFSLEQQKQWFGNAFNIENPTCFSLVSYLLRKYIQDTKKDITTTPLVLCSTKGDVAYLSSENDAPLVHLAQSIQQEFGLKKMPFIISNACISGIHGIIHAQRMITNQQAEEVIVIGVDAVSDFIRKGFQSLMATSSERCQPFDADRKGLNFGEAAGMIVLQKKASSYAVLGGGLSNDANHISGPSRDGSGLAKAVERAIGLHKNHISEENTFVSAHGTATIYNDEMECKAMNSLHLQNLNTLSYKAYFGHTLGACGVLETVLGLKTLEKGILPSSLGYENHGLTLPLQICTDNKVHPFKNFIKTGAGFGGCNAAILIEKVK